MLGMPKVCDAKYFKELMLLAMKDKAGGNLNEEENDFMLDNHYGDDSLEELNAAVIMMARIQPIDDKADAEQTCNTPKNMTTQRNTTWGATS
ncbi:hypothetical protein Tco_1241577 [Tanacetum coccineum]